MKKYYGFNSINWYEDPAEGWIIVYQRWINEKDYRVWFPVPNKGSTLYGYDKKAHEAFEAVKISLGNEEIHKEK